MKKLICKLVATFVILLIATNTVDLTAKNPPIGNPTPDYHIPIFNSIEDLINWIETADAANYQSGRFENCLQYWRNRGEIPIPHFSDPNVRLVSVQVIPFRDNGLMIHFVHSIPGAQIILRITRIDPRHIVAYEVGGIYEYFSATWGNEFEVSRISETTVSTANPYTGEIIARRIPYVLVNNLDDSPLNAFAFTMFINDGAELGFTYHDPRVTEFFPSLIWHTIPITDRSYEILQIPPPSPENTMRSAGFIIGSYTYFINGTIPRTTDVAPFIDPAVNRTMIPLRAVSEALLVEVNWLPATQTVQIISQIPEPTVHYLQVGVPLPDNMGTPVIVNDRVFIPLAYAAQLLNARTFWDGWTQSANVWRQVYWE